MTGLKKRRVNSEQQKTSEIMQAKTKMYEFLTVRGHTKHGDYSSIIYYYSRLEYLYKHLIFFFVCFFFLAES